MLDVFPGLAGILGLAAVGGVAARLMKQPPLIGYILAGIVLSVTGGIDHLATRSMMEIMGRLGVTLLLFLAGLELPLSELRKMGKVSLITGIGQIMTSMSLGYVLSRLIGFNSLTSLYLGVGLTFGSTIMVVKLLSEKGDLQSLSGKIAVGYLLVQDFVAVGMMVILSGVGSGRINFVDVGTVALKGVIMVVLAVMISGRVMGRILDYLARSTELVFITSIGWCLVVAAAVSSPIIGFSVEIGGLLAGLALANVSEQGQISSRTRPLRDFFLTWFFVALGANFRMGDLSGIFIPGILLSLFVLIVNPLIVMAILGAMGYSRRTYFMASFAVAQVSELSLIIMSSAVIGGQVEGKILSLITIVAIITMTLSTYMIWNAKTLYIKLGKYVSLFERKREKMQSYEGERLENHAVLFGHNRVGSRIRPTLERMVEQILVVDFNPVVVEELGQKGINVMYGDMSDHELYNDLSLQTARIIVSTVPDVGDSLLLLKGLKELKNKSEHKLSQVIIMTANDKEDAKMLYRKGASYVLLPHSVGGDFLSHVIEQHGKGEKPEDRLQSLENYLVRMGGVDAG